MSARSLRLARFLALFFWHSEPAGAGNARNLSYFFFSVNTPSLHMAVSYNNVHRKSWLTESGRAPAALIALHFPGPSIHFFISTAVPCRQMSSRPQSRRYLSARSGGIVARFQRRPGAQDKLVILNETKDLNPRVLPPTIIQSVLAGRRQNRQSLFSQRFSASPHAPFLHRARDAIIAMPSCVW